MTNWIGRLVRFLICDLVRTWWVHRFRLFDPSSHSGRRLQTLVLLFQLLITGRLVGFLTWWLIDGFRLFMLMLSFQIRERLYTKIILFFGPLSLLEIKLSWVPDGDRFYGDRFYDRFKFLRFEVCTSFESCGDGAQIFRVYDDAASQQLQTFSTFVDNSESISLVFCVCDRWWW